MVGLETVMETILNEQSRERQRAYRKLQAQKAQETQK